MGRARKAKELFTASEVAGFCQVDLKTIHNWADRGEIRHFRTPGRHLRFRSVDVLDFLRKYGYPIPEGLNAGKPRVIVLADDRATLSAAQRSLSKLFEVTTSQEPIDALITLGANAPDALVIGAKVGGIDASRLLERLKEHDSTRHVRTVLLSDDRHRSGANGASAVVGKPDIEQLGETLESLMGLNR